MLQQYAAKKTIDLYLIAGQSNAAATVTVTNASSSLTVTGEPTINDTVENVGTGYTG